MHVYSIKSKITNQKLLFFLEHLHSFRKGGMVSQKGFDVDENNIIKFQIVRLALPYSFAPVLLLVYLNTPLLVNIKNFTLYLRKIVIDSLLSLCEEVILLNCLS